MEGEPDSSLSVLGDLAATDPERARRLAIELAASSAPHAQPALLAVAGEASIKMGAVGEALALLRQAADLSERVGLPDSGVLRVRVAAMIAATGDSAEALVAIDAAERQLGERAWLAWYQRGLILHWAGRSEEAVEWLDRAEPAVRAAGDRLTEAKLTMNRALAHALNGDFERAAADAAAAERVCEELGELTLAAQARHNRGWIAAHSGDLADGWRLMHEAAASSSWVAPPVVLSDRAELANAAGLPVEASYFAEQAWVRQLDAGDDHGAAATLLLRARIALDAGSVEQALDLATEAAGELAAQGREALAGAAIAVEIAARRDLVERQAVGVERMARAALSAAMPQLVTVEANAWRAARLDGTLATGDLAALAGEVEIAETLYLRVEADAATTGRLEVRHHIGAASRHRLRTGELDRARLETAWEEMLARRPVEAVYELRGDWGMSSRLFTRAAVVPSLERGDGVEAIRWLERLRPLSAPPRDDEVLEIGKELRAVWQRRRSSPARADVDDGVIHDDAEAELEAALVDRARLVTSAQPPLVCPSADDLAAVLAGTRLVWVVALPAGSWTISLDASGAHVTTIDRVRLEQAARRLTASMRLGRGSWRDDARALDVALGIQPAAGTTVVIPIGSAVEDVTFGALPTLHDGPVRVCWSGAHWLRTAAPRHASMVTIASGGVEGSARERELLQRVWPGATVLDESRMTSSNVRAALAGSDIVHVGAHGHLRRDNPLLSTLECLDGPLYGYELAREERAASTVVLWSCALGGARMPADVGVTGWPALLADWGCNALIAAPGALPSGPAPDLAFELHRGLAAGDATDVILARLRRHASSDALASRAAVMVAVHGAG